MKDIHSTIEIGLQQRESKGNGTIYYNESLSKTCWIWGGVTPFHTLERPESLASLASSWAALLPSLLQVLEQTPTEGKLCCSDVLEDWMRERESDPKINQPRRKAFEPVGINPPVKSRESKGENQLRSGF